MGLWYSLGSHGDAVKAELCFIGAEGIIADLCILWTMVLGVSYEDRGSFLFR